MLTAATRIGLVIATAVCMVGCLAPHDRRPGLRLRGERVEPVPTDWSFTDAFREIAIEVRAPYGLRHSVTIWCSSVAGSLFVGAREPESKRWPGWVDRHPDVRLGIAGRLYDVSLEPVDDPDQIARVRQAYAAKYALPPPSAAAPPIRYWRVVPRR